MLRLLHLLEVQNKESREVYGVHALGQHSNVPQELPLSQLILLLLFERLKSGGKH